MNLSSLVLVLFLGGRDSGSLEELKKGGFCRAVSSEVYAAKERELLFEMSARNLREGAENKIDEFEKGRRKRALIEYTERHPEKVIPEEVLKDGFFGEGGNYVYWDGLGGKEGKGARIKGMIYNNLMKNLEVRERLLYLTLKQHLAREDGEERMGELVKKKIPWESWSGLYALKEKALEAKGKYIAALMEMECKGKCRKEKIKALQELGGEDYDLFGEKAEVEKEILRIEKRQLIRFYKNGKEY